MQKHLFQNFFLCICENVPQKKSCIIMILDVMMFKCNSLIIMHTFNAIKRSLKLSYCTLFITLIMLVLVKSYFFHFCAAVLLITLCLPIFHLSNKNVCFGIQGAQQYDLIVHLLSQKVHEFLLISHIVIMMWEAMMSCSNKHKISLRAIFSLGKHLDKSEILTCRQTYEQ